MDYFIHPTSVIDPPADIGAGTQIWLFSHISAQAKIGLNCIIGQNVFIDKEVKIGNRVKIQNNVSVYRGVDCEDDVFIGPSVVFTNVINPRSFIDRKSEIQHTLIGRGATIGANATIICGVEIGPYAFIGAGAVVSESVAPFSLVVGNPAKQIGWVSHMACTLQFDHNGKAICPVSLKEYLLDEQGVRLRDE